MYGTETKPPPSVIRDDAFEPSCLCGQTLISFGFGAIMGLVGLLSSNSTLITCAVQATGIAFGISGAQQENPFDISSREFLWLFSPAFISSYFILTIIGTESLFCVVISSALATVVAFATKVLKKGYDTKKGQQKQQWRSPANDSTV